MTPLPAMNERLSRISGVAIREPGNSQPTPFSAAVHDHRPASANHPDAAQRPAAIDHNPGNDAQSRRLSAAAKVVRAHGDRLALHAGLALFVEAVARALHSPLKRKLFDAFSRDELRAALEWRASLRTHPGVSARRLDVADARRQVTQVGRALVCLWCEVRIGAQDLEACLPSDWDARGLQTITRRWDTDVAGAGIIVVDELIASVRR